MNVIFEHLGHLVNVVKRLMYTVSHTISAFYTHGQETYGAAFTFALVILGFIVCFLILMKFFDVK